MSTADDLYRTQLACRIIEREFAKILENALIPVQSVRAALTTNEQIYVIANNLIYLMEIGSDDDDFDFFVLDGQPAGGPPRVRFPIPNDYIRLSGEDVPTAPTTVGELFDRDQYSIPLTMIKPKLTLHQIEGIRECPLDSVCGRMIENLVIHATAARDIVKATLGNDKEAARISDIVAETAAVIMLG